MKKCVILCVCGFAGAMLADAVQWRRAADGLWSDPAAWNPARVPVDGDQVSIGAGGVYTVSLPAGETVLRPYEWRLTAGNGASITFDGRNGTFLMPACDADTYREEPWGINASKGHFFNLETYNVTGTKRNAVVRMDNARFTVSCSEDDAKVDVRDGVLNFFDPEGVGHYHYFTTAAQPQRDIIISVQPGASMRLPNVNFRCNGTRTNLMSFVGGKSEIVGTLSMPSGNFAEGVVSTGTVEVVDGGELAVGSLRFGGNVGRNGWVHTSSNRTVRVVAARRGKLVIKGAVAQPDPSMAEVVARDGGELLAQGIFRIADGSGATGTVSVVDATATFSKELVVGGNNKDCHGEFQSSNAVVTVDNSVNVAEGLFRAVDSTLTLNSLYPGYGGSATSRGDAEIVGGRTTVKTVYAGLNSTGSLTVRGGADFESIGGDFFIGKDPNTVGEMFVADAATRVTTKPLLRAGYQGIGTLTVTGGLVRTTSLVAGDAAGSVGTVNLAGGRIETTTAEALLVGKAGAGTVNVSGGELETFQIRFNWSGNESTPTSVLHQTGGFISVTSTEKMQGVNLCDSRNTRSRLILDGGVFQSHLVRGWTGASARGGGWSVLEANGGTIRAHVPSTGFVETIDEARLGPKGLTLDSAFEVTIAQNFENKADEEGRLVLTGVGVKTLAGDDSHETFLDVAGGTARFAAGASHVSYVTVTNGATLSFAGDATGAAFTGLALGSADTLGNLEMELSDSITVTQEPVFGNFGLMIAGTSYADGTYPLIRYAGSASAETVRAWSAGYVAAGRVEGRSYAFTTTVDAEGTSFNLVVGAGMPLTATSVWNGPGAQWSDGANWLDVVPGAQSVARFSSENAPAHVTVSEAGTQVGALAFTAQQDYVLEGAGSLRISDSGYGKVEATGGEVTVGVGLELPATTVFDVAESASLTFEGPLLRGGVDKRGAGRMSLKSPASALATGIYVENGLLSFSGMDALGLGVGGLTHLTLQGGTVELRKGGELTRSLVVQTGNAEKAAALKADEDVTVSAAAVSSGALIKRGPGTVTFESAAGMTLSAGNGTCVLNANPVTAPIAFPENGVVPTEGYAGFNVADGEVVFRGGTYRIPNAICVGLNSKDLSDAEPAFTVDGARVETGTSSYHLLLGPNAYKAGAKFTRPRLTVKNGGYLSCNTLNTGKQGDYDVYPEILLDNGTLYGSWTINISERGGCHAVYVVRNGSQFLANNTVNWRGPAELTFTDSVFAKNASGDPMGIQVEGAGHGVWLFGAGSEFRCNAIIQKTNNSATFAFAGGRWIPARTGGFDFVFSKADRITVETRAAAGLKLAPPADAEYRMAKAITGAGGVVTDGAGTLRFVTQEIIQGDVTNKMQGASAAIQSPYTLDFEKTLDIRSGTVVVEAGAARPGARFAGAGTLAATDLATPVFELSIGEDGAAEQVLTLADFTSTGKVTVDLGRTEDTPLSRRTTDLLVARYTGAVPDVSSWKVANSGVDCVTGAFAAKDGEIRLSLKSTGCVFYIR